jgi:ankyrin repeat protein
VFVAVDYMHSATSVTALMVAAGRGFSAVVDQLLALGANPSLKASNGWTALDWAKRFNQSEVVELLEAHMYVAVDT